MDSLNPYILAQFLIIGIKDKYFRYMHYTIVIHHPYMHQVMKPQEVAAAEPAL
jgi:hypothetical protein